MNSKADELLKRLLATFRPEAEDHLKAMVAGVLELEKNPPEERQQAIVETVYREAHSLKGAARAVNLRAIETVCHSLESLLAALKHRQIKSSPGLFDGLHQALDTVAALLAAASGDAPTDTSIATADLLQRLTDLAKPTEPPVPRAAPPSPSSQTPPGSEVRQSAAALEPARPDEERPEAPAAHTVGAPSAISQQPASPGLSQTVRIATAKLDSVLLQTEEMLSLKLVAAQRVADLRQLAGLLDQWSNQWSRITPEVRALQHVLEPPGPGRDRENGHPLSAPQLAKISGFLDWNRRHVHGMDDRLRVLARSFEQEARALGGMIDNLMRDVRKVVLLPFASLIEAFPKMVRDLSRAQGKEVECVMRNADVEVDKRILEELKDPLVQLVRNSLDHGLEKPDARARQGKPTRGTLTLAIERIEGNRVEIRVADDGQGIDVPGVQTAAQRVGCLPAQSTETLTREGALDLIFQSEVSTSPIITNLSGRGLGLAIVREKLNLLGGTVSVETKTGTGTTFRLVVPVTMATVRGILVKAADQVFVVPTLHVEQVARVKRDAIRTVENRETILLADQAIALVALEDVLGLPHPTALDGDPAFLAILVVANGGQRIAFSVAQVLSEQEVLVKRLTRPLARLRNIAGATVLGTGKVIPILSVPDLMKSAMHVATGSGRTTSRAAEKEAAKAILVAEDSITFRMLLQTILESAGYRVETAVDGAEAWTALRSGAFDALVSDVEMPRMNGFELAARVRDDKTLAELPVVLVTSLESREDRERGVEAGANAYLVKRSFDQSNLLEVVGRLI